MIIKESGRIGSILCLVLTSAFCARQGAPDLHVEAGEMSGQRVDTETRLRALYGAVLRFHRQNHELPTSLNQACDPYPERCELLDPGDTPLDFWNSAVSYTLRADGFELRSFGPDRMSATSDDIVIAHPLDRAIAGQVAGCYRSVEGWWTSRQSVVRFDTLPGTLFNHLGNYSLHIPLPRHPMGMEWFPVGTDSISLQWAYGPHIRDIRMKRLGDTLRGRTDFEDVDSRGVTIDWRGVLTLVRTSCDG
ncbi:MAG: hypothetical protein ACREX3_01950 [Gammaproteobacteria bacterium]